ncbi:MAG: dockerin type I repeat-containing protein [Ruminococcus sp.]
MRIRKNISITLTVLLALIMLVPSVTAAKTDNNLDIVSTNLPTYAETNDIDTNDLCSVYLLGDANGDSKVDIKDATAVQKHIANIITLTAVGISAADTNGDGIVNIKDSTDVQKHLAGVSINSSIGQENEYSSTPAETVNPPEPTTSAGEESTTDAEENATEPDDYYDSINYLQALIKTAEDYLAPGNYYVFETGLRLQNEIDNAKALCDSDTAAYREITAQIAALQEAIDGLIPIKEDDIYKEINFNVSEEFRINGYGSDETELYLITSVSEMEAVISKVEGSEYGSIYTTPTISEKYNDAYFENNSLIISLNLVGGSNCTQTIDRISVEGNTLTVHRSLYKPQIVLCDMNYQYVLIEVSNADISGVTNTINHNTFITVEN